MTIRTVRKSLRWLVKGGILFSLALMLAIALSSGLTKTNSVLPSKSTQSPPPQVSSSMPAAVDVQSKYGRSFIHYATVSRSDGSFRNMFIAAESLVDLQPETALPDDTLILMETWNSPDSLGSIFIKQKQDGDWQYGSFPPSQPDYRVSTNSSCNRCHTPFRKTDFTLTLPLLKEALRTRQVQTAFCDRSGRTPCDPAAYTPTPS